MSSVNVCFLDVRSTRPSFPTGLSDQHQVPNLPCDRADQHIFLFHHLTYFHKLNAKAATKLIRALITNKDPAEPLFHCNETIVVTNNSSVEQKIRRSKKSSARSNDQPIYSNPFMKSRPYYPYATIEVPHAHRLDPNHLVSST